MRHIELFAASVIVAAPPALAQPPTPVQPIETTYERVERCKAEWIRMRVAANLPVVFRYKDGYHTFMSACLALAKDNNK